MNELQPKPAWRDRMLDGLCAGLPVASGLLFPVYWLLLRVPTPRVPMLGGQTRDLRHEVNFREALQIDLSLSLSVPGAVLLGLSQWARHAVGCDRGRSRWMGFCAIIGVFACFDGLYGAGTVDPR